MVEINRLSHRSLFQRPALVDQVKAVFSEAAAQKRFPSEEAKEAFFHRWVSYYIEHCSEEVFWAEENGDFLGYLTGCRDSLAALPHLSSGIKSYPLFEDLFTEYPAHLHINLTAAARGKGVGSQLISAYCTFLKQNGVHGVHLITSPDAKNVGFYLKNGFHFQQERKFNGTPLLFMGRSL